MYKGYAVYRFLDENKNIIYIGMTNNAYRRIFKQHFTNHGHLPDECYKSTCRVDIVKLENNLEAKGLENYLINKYRPKFNKKDKEKDIFIINKYGRLGDFYSSLEHWKPFRKLKNFKSPDPNNNLTPIENMIFNVLAIISAIAGVYIYSLLIK